MSGKKERNRSGLRRGVTSPRVGKIRRLKKARSSAPNAFLPVRYGVKFPPDAVMDHRVVLEILYRRKLDKWLGKLRLEKGIESSVGLSTNDRADLPLLSRPIVSAPGREFEMTIGSTPTSPQLVDDVSPDPQAGSSISIMPVGQSVVKEPSFVEPVVDPNPHDSPLVFTISSSEDDS